MAAQTENAKPPKAPGVPVREDDARERTYTRLGIASTLAFLVVGVFNPARDLIRRNTSIGIWPALLDLMVIFVITFYVWGQLVYEWCRLGYLACFADHQPPNRDQLEAIFDRDDASALVVLVPAYCEPPAVLRMTLMSAALLEHPNHTVALLIDNPPDPSDSAAAAELDATRRTVDEIENALRTQQRSYAAELSGFRDRIDSGDFVALAEGRGIELLYLRVARWLEEQAQSLINGDYVEVLFAEGVLREPARIHRARAADIAARSLVEAEFTAADALHEYRRLAALFSARMLSFERKRYLNLSHVKNKAANLNSFISLLGRSFRDDLQPDGLHLEECDPPSATLLVPDPEYVIICDADSLLLHDYALKLVPVMEHPDGKRIAVAQVHSLAVPNSPRALQRVAGSQTDITRVVGHGSVRHGAAFWAGNNAMLRCAALKDIEEPSFDRGFPIKVYIRDRTLIEDTETTIEFISRGWQIYSLPEMLAYVGTPSDYGALLIQRRRWAGGGLLNVPKLVSYLRAAPDRLQRVPEALLRLHYLGLAAANFGWFMMPIMVAPSMPPPGWWILMCLPFVMLYWHDLIQLGCSRDDIVRVQALNMLLIPVSIEGVLSAMRHFWTGDRRSFPRTPKNKFRTPAPASYAAFAILLPVLAALFTLWDIFHGTWPFAVFGLLNTMLLTYALVRLVGLVEAATDIRSAIRRSMKPATPPTNIPDRSAEAIRF